MKSHLDVRSYTLLLLVAALLQLNCAPVFSDFQSARLVGKGRFEATPSFTSVSFSEDGRSEHVQYNLGALLAFGLHDRVDASLKYARVIVPGEDEDAGVNVVGFGPKIGMVRDRVALFFPVGFAFGEDIQSSESWTFQPTLLLTSLLGRHVELTPSAKVILPLSEDDRDTLVAINLGFGLSQDLARWAVRPEIGLLFNPGESGVFWAIGVGFNYRFSSK